MTVLPKTASTIGDGGFSNVLAVFSNSHHGLTLRGFSISFYLNLTPSFLNAKVKSKSDLRSYKLNPPSEGVRIHADMERGYPVEVFGDHGLCAGLSTSVFPMLGPHMHSQVEINYVLSGSMTYQFDGREITLGAGKLALFWGMVPHQVSDCEKDTTFVVIYAPMSMLIEMAGIAKLQAAVFGGGMLQASLIRTQDQQQFLQWRQDLVDAQKSKDKQLIQIVQDELGARIRRIEREGWVDLRNRMVMAATGATAAPGHERAKRVEQMVRHISEHALEDISVDDVAAAAGLHPNYAMALYKRVVGMSIKQSILRHRLDTAQSLLISSDTPVSKTGFACGFGSVSSFYSAFEKRFGTSPQLFRQSIRAHQEEMSRRP
jgi:AraC family transcriptional regulator, melibiose operon regulatory protein